MDEYSSEKNLKLSPSEELFEINLNDYKTFKNISITICDTNYVIVHKNANPTIHFVIRHPKLANAIKTLIL